MISQPENRGGLLGQLRGYALRGSDEEAWNEQTPQVSTLSRATSLHGEVSETIRVDFIAKKEAIGRQALRTSYVLQADLTQSDLPLEFLPSNVVEVLRKKKVPAGDGEDEPKTVVIDHFSDDDEEIDEHEFDGYDEMRFRHVRRVRYQLDGRGALASCMREDVYEDDDEGGVDIVSLRTVQSGSVEDDESEILSLQGWGKDPEIEHPLEFVLHPHLQKLIEKQEKKKLREDMLFLDIVRDYVVEKDLLKHTHLEYQRAMMTLLAFLSWEATAKEVQDLI